MCDTELIFHFQYKFYVCKFKNTPGKVLKKSRVKNVAASEKRKIKFIEGIKSIDKYFSNGKEEVAANVL